LDRDTKAIQRIHDAALELFSSRGYRATSVRDIATRASVSTGNVYHHFGNKERIYQQLMEEYWEKLRDPDLPLNQLFARARFPEELEELARLTEQVVDQHMPYILLIYVDVIEFQGKHIHEFYRDMHQRFARAYGENLERGQQEGRFGEADPLVGVMIAARWFFYYFTVEKAFGVPQHLGLESTEITRQFIEIIKHGVLARRAPTEGGA